MLKFQIGRRQGGPEEGSWKLCVDFLVLLVAKLSTCEKQAGFFSSSQSCVLAAPGDGTQVLMLVLFSA